MKKFLYLLSHICLITLFFWPKQVRALAEFSTAVTTEYLVQTDLKTKITHTIELSNNFAHIYPTVYNLAITAKDISDIEVKVMGNTVDWKQEQQPSLTTLHIPIQHPQIGKDQKTILTITYSTSSLVDKVGTNYTLTLPKMAKGNEAISFVRQLIIPPFFPELSYSSLNAQQQNNNDANRTYHFVGSGDQNITLHFGQSASYNLKLSYLLKNQKSVAATSELALPPDTSYQRVILDSIIPEPTEIVIDSDGNWLARYLLEPLSKLEVNAVLNITTSPTPLYFDPSSSAPLSSLEYWEQTPAIERLATNLKTPQNVYNYLITTLSYDYNQITRSSRLGAEAALNNPTSAICTEFTDLFVTVSRTMGVPSRAIIGYALTSNQALRPFALDRDVLHAYPEFQDPETKTWHSIDPTWGHTTGGTDYYERLDFGHIAFVRLGIDSSYPLPAGSYRESFAGKQIEVTPLDHELTFPESSYKTIEENGKLYLQNSGKSAIVNENITLNSKTISISYLPPYGKFYLPDTQLNYWWSTHSYLKPYLVALIPILITATLLVIIYKKMVR